MGFHAKASKAQAFFPDRDGNGPKCSAVGILLPMAEESSLMLCLSFAVKSLLCRTTFHFSRGNHELRKEP